MSEKRKQPLSHVLPVAQEIAGALELGCVRVEIAGSLRRQKPDIGDIEIVALPVYDLDLFGETLTTSAELSGALRVMLACGILAWDEVVSRNGDRYKRFVVPKLGGMALDLFLAQQDNFGNVLAIRTGSADFSARLMTQRSQGGLMPQGMRQRDGFLWQDDRRLSCPTEEAFFAALGVSAVPAPEERDEACIDTLRKLALGIPSGKMAP